MIASEIADDDEVQVESYTLLQQKNPSSEFSLRYVILSTHLAPSIKKSQTRCNKSKCSVKPDVPALSDQVPMTSDN